MKDAIYIRFWDGDKEYTIPELEEYVARIKKEFGSKSKVHLDAGANNVSVMVTPSKKVKRCSNCGRYEKHKSYMHGKKKVCQ